MDVVFAGTPETALPSLEALLASRHRVLAVVTRPDAPVGRGRTLRPSPVAEAALAAGLEVLRPARVREPDFADRLTALAPDCVPIVAYGALIPASLIAVPRHGWVNLHFSRLPAWRGAAPVQRAVWAGDPVTGATTFALVPELDAGPVYAELTEAIGPEDSAGALLDRLAVRGAELLVATLDGIEDGTLTARPQPAEGISLAPKLIPEDGRLDWQRSAAELDRQIRACTPAPGAWTTLRGQRFKIGAARPISQNGGLTPGALAVTRKSVRVGTGDGSLELVTVQPPGKRAMPAVDWARGVQTEQLVLGA
ncbi:methionyl-tRNA formyltransferase [Friedmanniella endophytica]|uniref:Methionyl-tRNA formyltransferase n=1 Tax=Microlunatus kandeliicorticis TaxID=1759536 RepID=A0A7W3ITR3_9ACTN|nr:methionyl-tRNA formyltransferase [Microlunatus kandeliicorticis]MBA8795077.1 methionyl-tRNA formyltransferase [Microlunatus kandeliicorticis]